ncbi:MAG: sugar phosphate isomerase/epimerase family protein, partial [Terriglobia bacterium]
MDNKMVRRRFLQSAGMLAAAGAGFGLPHVGMAEGGQEVSPAEVRKIPRLLPGCCAYSYRKYLQHGPM